MSRRTTAEQAQDRIDRRDKERRIEEEKEILKLAEGLTNGHAGCPKTTGKVIQWMVKEQISHGEILRSVADVLPTLQSKDSCALAHGKVVGQLTLLGMTFKVPLTTAIVCGLIYCLVKF